MHSWLYISMCMNLSRVPYDDWTFFPFWAGVQGWSSEGKSLELGKSLTFAVSDTFLGWPGENPLVDAFHVSPAPSTADGELMFTEGLPGSLEHASRVQAASAKNTALLFAWLVALHGFLSHRWVKLHFVTHIKDLNGNEGFIMCIIMCNSHVKN